MWWQARAFEDFQFRLSVRRQSQTSKRRNTHSFPPGHDVPMMCPRCGKSHPHNTRSLGSTYWAGIQSGLLSSVWFSTRATFVSPNTVRYHTYRAVPYCTAPRQSVRESERAGMAQECLGVPGWLRSHRRRGPQRRGGKRDPERENCPFQVGGAADRWTGGASQPGAPAPGCGRLLEFSTFKLYRLPRNHPKTRRHGSS